MKFSLTENDKSTYWDEVLLGIMILACIGAGIALIVFKPSFWIISKRIITLLGVFICLLGLMFIPSLFYRLAHNDKE